MNAAHNILAEGMRLLAERGHAMVAAGRAETENACGAEARPRASSGAHGVEAGGTARAASNAPPKRA